LDQSAGPSASVPQRHAEGRRRECPLTPTFLSQ
jgi:hypothetical protein